MILGRPINVRRFARGFHHALEGILDAYRSQRHMRVHFVFMALNAILALLYKLTALEVAVLMLCMTLVVFAEMVNTVIEATLNMVTETYHPITRFAKDVAAGGVLITALNACVVGLCIYCNPERLQRFRSVWVEGAYQDDSAMLRAVAMSVILLLVVITFLKVGRPQGGALRGGAVSGHTAFAFCCTTCLYFLIRDTRVAYIGLALAGIVSLLVAQLRLHDPSHRVRTVVYGAAIGVAIPLIVFQLLARPTPL